MAVDWTHPSSPITWGLCVTPWRRFPRTLLVLWLACVASDSASFASNACGPPFDVSPAAGSRVQTAHRGGEWWCLEQAGVWVCRSRSTSSNHSGVWGRLVPVMALRGGGADGRRDIRGWGGVGGVSKGPEWRNRGGKTGSQRGRGSGDARKSRHGGRDEVEEESEDWGEENVPLGKHLAPVVRPKKSETLPSASTVLSMDEAVARKRERERQRARSHESTAGHISVTVDERHRGSKAGGGVLQITPKELQKMSKGKLLKLAKQSGLKVVCQDNDKSLLSNRDVRTALEPFLPSDEALDALARERDGSKARPSDRKRGKLPSKSKYLASVWVDGEERSVYGVGHPKDCDFVSWATECIDELEHRETIQPTGPTRSKKDRETLVPSFMRAR